MSEEDDVCPECYRGWGPNPPVPVVGEKETVTVAWTREETQEVLYQLQPDYPYELEKRTEDPLFTARTKLIAALDLARTEGEK